MVNVFICCRPPLRLSQTLQYSRGMLWSFLASNVESPVPLPRAVAVLTGRSNGVLTELRQANKCCLGQIRACGYFPMTLESTGKNGKIRHFSAKHEICSKIHVWPRVSMEIAVTGLEMPNLNILTHKRCRNYGWSDLWHDKYLRRGIATSLG
jgi:hypothetical protein